MSIRIIDFLKIIDIDHNQGKGDFVTQVLLKLVVKHYLKITIGIQTRQLINSTDPHQPHILHDHRRIFIEIDNDITDHAYQHEFKGIKIIPLQKH